MNLQHTFLTCGLVMAAGSAAIAQTPTKLDRELPPLQSIMSQSFGMDHVDGALRAGGPKYKAVFESSGMEYTPALSAKATRNYPLQFTLQTIRRGDQALYDAATDSARAPQQQGMIASYERGAGITETYEARSTGLKQNFTFASKPGGQGDLIVTGRITTELVTAERGEQNDGLSFSAEGIGGVAIGQVVGLDQSGQQVAGRLSFDGEIVQFVLPATFVEQATYPMVLDPLFGTVLMVEVNGARDPDVAFDETYDDFLVVWEHEFSALDIDVRGQKFDLSGNLVASAIFITSESGNEINPSVGNVDIGSDYFVAYQDGDTAFGPWDIRGRRVNGGTTTATSVILEIATTAANEITPDVGGDSANSATAGDGVIVVWDDSTGITAAKIDLSLVAIVAGPRTLFSASNATNPAISKSAGAAGRHAVVWEQQFAVSKDITVALVDRNLVVLDLSAVASSIAGNEFNADVDGDGTSFLSVYQKNESGQSGPSDIYCRRLQWNGAAIVATGVETLVDGTPNANERDPAVGFLGRKYVVAWAEATSGLDYDVAAIELNPQNCLACGVKQVSQGGPSNVVDIGVEIATRYHGRATSNPATFDQAMIVWMDATSSPPFDSDIVAQYYEAYGGGVITNLGGACGNGGTNGFNGPVAIGNTDLKLTVSGAASDLLLASIQFAPIAISCGPCTINAESTSYFFSPGVGGTSSFALPVPCNLGLLGVPLHTQWAVLLSGANPCAVIPPSLQLSWSNRLLTTIDT